MKFLSLAGSRVAVMAVLILQGFGAIPHIAQEESSEGHLGTTSQSISRTGPTTGAGLGCRAGIGRRQNPKADGMGKPSLGGRRPLYASYAN